ncbi:unnamed protein product, partial [Brenthis ino]
MLKIHLCHILITFFVFLCFLNSNFCLERGDDCNADDFVGVCKTIHECPYAIFLVEVELKYPPMCKWEEMTPIVCCDDCNVSDVVGICKSIFDCPYAFHLVNVEEKKPPMCKWEETTRIVCCPT